MFDQDKNPNIFLKSIAPHQHFLHVCEVRLKGNFFHLHSVSLVCCAFQKTHKFILSHTVTLCSVMEIENGSEGNLEKNFITQHSSFSVAFSVHSNVHIFAFLYVLTFRGQHLNVRHLYQSNLCCLQ